MYTPPTVDEIMRSLRSSVKAEVVGTDPWVWPNNLVPVLKALSQAFRAAYLRLEFIHEQAFVTTARGDYLDWHGIQAGGLSRAPATFATGDVEVDAVLGTVIPDNTSIARLDGVAYVTVGTTTAVDVPTRVAIKAVDPGALPNTDPGAEFVALIPIVGIDTPFVVSDTGILGGQESESDDSFRQRILFHKQNPPHGGSPSEYVEWAMTMSGVTRVFVQRATPAPGQVTVYFMMDDIGTGIPSGAYVDAMQTLLESEAPADADVIAAAPTPVPVDVEVSNLVPDTAAVRDAVVAELKAQFLRKAQPASPTTPFTFSKSWLDEAVSMAPNWRRSKITDPPDDIVFTTAGEIPVLGTVTFV